MCGQAMSHCVNYTTRDLIDNWGSDLSNIILLTDGIITYSLIMFSSQY